VALRAGPLDVGALGFSFAKQRRDLHGVFIRNDCCPCQSKGGAQPKRFAYEPLQERTPLSLREPQRQTPGRPVEPALRAATPAAFQDPGFAAAAPASASRDAKRVTMGRCE